MPLSQRELAKVLKVDPSHVSRLVKAGMPLTSVEAATAWREENAKEGVGHKSKAMIEAAEHLASASLPAIDVSAVSDDDPRSALNRARENEINCHKLLRSAFDAERVGMIPGLLRMHSQAITNRLEAERSWDKHRARMGELVSLEFAKELISRKLAPLDAQLRNFPKMAAARVNPDNPAFAEAELTAVLNPLLGQIAST